MAKVKNIITYYNAGKQIAQNVLTQPPDVLTQEAADTAITLLLRMHRELPADAHAIITQGDAVIKRFDLKVIDHHTFNTLKQYKQDKPP